MKFKIVGLLLSASLVLAACNSEDGNETSNEGAETEGGTTTTGDDASNAETGDKQETSTDVGGTEQDQATEENTPDDAGGSDDADDSESDGSTATVQTTDDPSKAGSQNDTENTDAARDNVALEDISLNTEDAISIAQEEFDGEIHEISFEQERNEWIYTVEMRNDSEEAQVVVNHETEEVMDVKTEEENGDDSNEVIDYDTLHPSYDAIDEAIADLGGGEIREWSLSMEDGVPEYQIDLFYEDEIHEYTIDAETLEILETEKDD